MIAEDRPFDTVLIVGAGFMGAQIALRAAAHGYTVWLHDTAEEVLARATGYIERLCDEHHIVGGERLMALTRLHLTTHLNDAAAQAGLVIEAVPEHLELKRQVFAQLDQLCPSHTILVTNSSSIRISAIEDVTCRPGKVANLHFYGTIAERPMVDIMRGTVTSDDTIARVRQFACSIEVTPLLVRKESTGFIFNRVWRSVKRESLHVVDAGVASHEDVDRAWMIFTGMSVGPFGLMDMIGLDVIRDIELVYQRESGDVRDAPPPVLLDKIARGELGIKTGQGFYTYPYPAYEDPLWLKGEEQPHPCEVTYGDQPG